MQLTEFRREFNKNRWGLDVIVCIAAAMSLPILIRIWTFPLKASPLDVTQLLTGFIGITFVYLLGSVLGKWLVRIRSMSFVWTAVVGSVLYAIVKTVLVLPGEIEHHGRFFADSTLTGYLIKYLVPPFIFVVFVFGGFSLIATLGVRLFCVAFRLLGSKEV